jgi:hypothetical protein
LQVFRLFARIIFLSAGRVAVAGVRDVTAISVGSADSLLAN